ncbi:hypothetical protein LMH87_000728 [Akanthomyces muscarius]|uniref:Anucleate primary sterigmata protein B n=1 Tax=Akanthomyces muscarius TaxID=2231603 RepID=A0A9W8QF43_AKAMU|nr:hypothetical protein LMH87_000728 [Akanthomyces muscarius]KAJ4155487.1 hypothetical protein LMH87_000728 [Akanthomyces muscarius]
MDNRPRSRRSNASRGSSRNASPHAADASSSTVAAPVTNNNASQAALRQHFQEVESSFLPTLSPVPTAPAKGQPATDDTFLFDSPQKIDLPHLPALRRNEEPDSASLDREISQLEEFDSPLKAAARYNEEPDSASLDRRISQLEEFDSSPLKAAVARTIERVLTEQQAKNVHVPDSVADELKESLADEFEKSMIEEYMRNSMDQDIKESISGELRRTMAEEIKESEADEFKFQSALEYPANKRHIPDTLRGLTLKEQNSTIERLSKQNFDLKLKVSFLTKRLGDTSDENVNATLAANVELNNRVSMLQSDNKVLRKQIKELRKRIEEDEDRPSTSGSGSDQPSDREQELLKHVFYLEQQLEKVTIRNETLEASMASTLHVVEQVRHDNSELRRDLGAQTSMLTSRNREGEILRQQIEELKFAQGGSGPVSTADSILERSASRAGARRSPPSSHTLLTAAQDAEREDLENRLARARDGMNEVKLKNHELEREIELCMTDFEKQVERAKAAKDYADSLVPQLNVAVNDCLALQSERSAAEGERDTARAERDQIAAEFESLQDQAQAELDTLDLEIEELQAQLADRDRDFNALQISMRDISEKVIAFEDDTHKKNRMIQRLEAELDSANRELGAYEQKLAEESEKNRRLSVQQESLQSEIAFLREEQEADKIRIGNLETTVADEKDRAKELDERLQQERTQREMVANQEKQQVQQFVNELNREASDAKDEARRLRKNLTSRETEAKVWKERLQELEDNLRNALGDLNITRTGFVESITKMQREHERTLRKLDMAKASVAEKDRTVRHRDNAIEQFAMDTRKNAHRMEKLERMEIAYQKLKVDYETLKTANDVRARAAAKSSTGSCPSPSVHRGPGERDKPLMMRLKAMETKLLAEREARTQDREMARGRLATLEAENKGLRGKVARRHE